MRVTGKWLAVLLLPIVGGAIFMSTRAGKEPPPQSKPVLVAVDNVDRIELYRVGPGDSLRLSFDGKVVTGEGQIAAREEELFQSGKGKTPLVVFYGGLFPTRTSRRLIEKINAIRDEMGLETTFVNIYDLNGLTTKCAIVRCVKDGFTVNGYAFASMDEVKVFLADSSFDKAVLLGCKEEREEISGRLKSIAVNVVPSLQDPVFEERVPYPTGEFVLPDDIE